MTSNLSLESSLLFPETSHEKRFVEQVALKFKSGQNSKHYFSIICTLLDDNIH